MVQQKVACEAVLELASPTFFACETDALLLQYVENNTETLDLRTLDGRLCTTLSSFYEEMARTLDFPSYFGHNLNALFDCMSDELAKGRRPLVIKVANAELWLSGESADAMHGVQSVFARIGKVWARGISEGQEWDTSPRKLLVLLAYS